MVALAILGGFFVVVAPLFATSGSASADVAGEIPTQATAGRTVEVDVGYDNTGNSVIDPTCLRIGVQGPLQASTVTFQGLDVETVRNNEACGGSLNGQETISLKVVLTALGAGTAHLTLEPAQGTTVLGPGIAGNVTIAAG